MVALASRVLSGSAPEVDRGVCGGMGGGPGVVVDTWTTPWGGGHGTNRGGNDRAPVDWSGWWVGGRAGGIEQVTGIVDYASSPASATSASVIEYSSGPLPPMKTTLSSTTIASRSGLASNHRDRITK